MRGLRVSTNEARSIDRPDPSREAGDAATMLGRLYPRLVASARSIDRGAAEDLAHDALIETLVRYPNFDGLVHPLGYTRTVLFRAAFRRARRTREVPGDVSALLDHVRDPAVRVVDGQRVAQALERIGHRQRACVVLRYLEGLDDDEIASVLGCRPSTVRSQIARGLARMRLSLDEEERP